MNRLITEEEFNEKYYLYAKELFKISYGYTKCKKDSEDIIQNVFMKYLHANKKFKKENDEKYWLIRVTINESIDFVKSYYHRNVVLSEETVNNTLEKNSAQEQLITSYVMKLPKKYQAVIILYYYEQNSINSISNILKISESAVKMRLKRAKSYLKKTMEE